MNVFTRKRKYTVEVEVVRVKITLACTECKQRNYNMTKEKKNHPERMETKKCLPEAFRALITSSSSFMDIPMGMVQAQCLPALST